MWTRSSDVISSTMTPGEIFLGATQINFLATLPKRSLSGYCRPNILKIGSNKRVVFLVFQKNYFSCSRSFDDFRRPRKITTRVPEMHNSMFIG